MRAAKRCEACRAKNKREWARVLEGVAAPSEEKHLRQEQTVTEEGACVASQ